MNLLKTNHHFYSGIVLWSAFPLFTELPLWSTLLFLFVLLSVFTREQWEITLLPLPFKNVLTFVSLIGTVIQFKTLRGYEPAINFFVLITVLKLFETRSSRDKKILLYFLLLLVMGNALYFQSLLITVHILISLVFIFTKLLELSKNITEGNNFFHSCLHLGKLFIPSIPIVIIVFLLFPRYGGPLGGLGNVPTPRLIGFSDELHPQDFAKLFSNDSLVFRAQIKESPSPLYWRGLVLAQTDGFSWKTLNEPERILLASNLYPQDENSPTISQKIILEASHAHFLFALDTPWEISNFSHQSFMARHFQGQSFKSNRPIPIRLQYEAISRNKNFYPDHLSKLERNTYLSLPSPVYQSQTARLVHNLKGKNTGESVRNFLQYFSTNFAYSLSPGEENTKKSPSPLDHFIFEQKRGVCGHFASSFAIMMRLIGIPSRIISGYRGGEYNEYGNYWSIKENHAHAWVEIYDDTQGWKRIDPTAFIPMAPSAEALQNQSLKNKSKNPLMRFLYQTSMFTDSISFKWNQFLLNYDLEFQKNAFKKIFKQNFVWFKALGFVFVMIATLMFFSFFIQNQKFSFYKRKSPQEQLTETYLKFATRLGKKIYEGPEDFLKRIELHDARPVIENYIKFRYVRPREISKEDLKSFKRLVKSYYENKYSTL